MDGSFYSHNYALIVLVQPLFSDVTVNEGELLTVTCIFRNIPDITTSEVLDPNGIPVMTTLGVFNVPSVTRAFAGTYTCVVSSTRDNSSVTASSTVIIQCKLSILYQIL